MSGKPWSAEEVAVLMARYPNEPTEAIAATIGRKVGPVYQKAAGLGLKKSAEYMAGPHACRLRRGDNVGAKNRFKPGAAPWNKGIPFHSGGRSAETQFKPGQKPHGWHPVGHQRITKEGYLQRKMTDTGTTRRDYVAVHHLVWIELHGPIPAGHAVCFKDGDKTRIEGGNLELVSRRDLMLRNSVQRFGKEVASLIQLRGALNRQINQRLKGEKNEQSNHR